jgi:hypothetical protein
MWNKPDEKELSSIPKLYETEKVSMKNKIIHLHFFLSGTDWYICEYDPEQKMFFGFVILDQDYFNAEWGYISLAELERVNAKWLEVDRDFCWTVRKARQVKKICEANGWSSTYAY